MENEDGPGVAPAQASGSPAGGSLLDRVRGRGLVGTALLAFAVFFGLLVYGDARAVADAFVRFDWAFLPIVVVLTLVAYVLRFAKWELYLRVLDIDLGLQRSAIVFLSGLMMTVTPGKVGEVWKAWLTERTEGAEVSRVLPAVAAERVTDLVALTGLALVGVGVYETSPIVLGGVLAAFLLLVLAIRWRSLSLAVLRRVEDWPLVGGFAEQLETIYEGSFDLFATGPLAGALAFSLVAWGLEGLALWAALAGFGVSTGPLLPVFAFGLGSVLGALSMLPGGLGAAEASMVGALVTAGVARPAAVGATLVVRAGTLWFGAILGAVVFLAYRKMFERSGATTA